MALVHAPLASESNRQVAICQQHRFDVTLQDVITHALQVATSLPTNGHTPARNRSNVTLQGVGTHVVKVAA